MRLGLTSAILHDFSLAELAAFCDANRLKSLELMCWPVASGDSRKFAGVTHVNVDDIIDNGPGLVQQTLYENGDVAISGLGYYPNVLTADVREANVYISHLMKVIRAASILRVPVVNTFVGRDQYKTVDANWPQFMKIWVPLIKYAEDHGVKIGIENCPMKFTLDEWPGGKNLATSPAIWQRMFSDIDSPNFGLNFDPSHLVLQGMDVQKALRGFGGKLLHAHAKDLEVDYERLDEVGFFADKTTDWHTPRIPGNGDVPWDAFFQVLEDVGFQGDVTIEVEDPDFNTREERLGAVLDSRDFLEQFIAPDAEIA